ELAQRPARHADQRHRAGQGDVGDLLDHVGGEPAGGGGGGRPRGARGAGGGVGGVGGGGTGGPRRAAGAARGGVRWVPRGARAAGVAMSRLRSPPRESRTMRACRLLTALAFWRLRRCSFLCSWGRKGRTLTVSMDRLHVADVGASRRGDCFYAPPR